MRIQAILLLLLITLGMLAANSIAWRPGVGSRKDKLPGTELERFFGWPATYRADWWQSDDPTLASRILQSAPFYWPQAEMRLGNRYTGIWAVVINLAFWICACTFVAAIAVRAVGLILRLTVAGISVAGLLLCLRFSDFVSVHL